MVNIIELNSVYDYDAIDFLCALYEEYGDNSIEMFLVDLPYTFKGKRRVTANRWDVPIDMDRFFELTSRMLTDDGALVLTATNPFSAYLIMKSMELEVDDRFKDVDMVNFKYEWIWEKDNGSNFMHVKHQPFKVHEQVLIFGKSATTYVKSGRNMLYNPQFTKGVPYKVNRSGMTENLATSDGYERTSGEYGDKRYPRSVQKVNGEKGFHPTQKPTDLFDYLIKTYTDEGDTVVDCCVGSGTTAVSAINTNRNYIVNDLHLEYAELTERRISETNNGLSTDL